MFESRLHQGTNSLLAFFQKWKYWNKKAPRDNSYCELVLQKQNWMDLNCNSKFSPGLNCTRVEGAVGIFGLGASLRGTCSAYSIVSNDSASLVDKLHAPTVQWSTVCLFCCKLLLPQPPTPQVLKRGEMSFDWTDTDLAVQSLWRNEGQTLHTSPVRTNL